MSHKVEGRGRQSRHGAGSLTRNASVRQRGDYHLSAEDSDRYLVASSHHHRMWLNRSVADCRLRPHHLPLPVIPEGCGCLVGNHVRFAVLDVSFYPFHDELPRQFPSHPIYSELSAQAHPSSTSMGALQWQAALNRCAWQRPRCRNAIVQDTPTTDLSMNDPLLPSVAVLLRCPTTRYRASRVDTRHAPPQQ